MNLTRQVAHGVLAMLTLATVTAHAAIINVSGGGDALQNAITSASAGDTLLVEPGTYWPISTANKAITIESTGGADVTFIDGGNTNRCATLGTSTSHTNTVLTGFTLMNGNAGDADVTIHTHYGSGSLAGTLNHCILTGNTGGNGGGSYQGVLNNCLLTNNMASNYGGGAYYGTLNNCTLTGNTAASWGGGAADATLNNCTLTGNKTTSSGTSGGGGGVRRGTLNNCTLSGNSAYVGGGAHESGLYNCTLTGNTATYGGGSCGGTLINCIVWGNTDSAGVPNHFNSAFHYSCTEPLPDTGTGNISDDPLFVDAENGDFRLQPDSPCIGKGNNDYVTWAFDLDGNPRIRGGTVDMGAYEFQAPGSDAYLSEPGGAGAAPTATTAYDGFVYDDNNTVRGTMTLNAKMAVKKNKDGSATTNWTFSAKAVLQNASISFSGKTNGVVERFTAATKNNAETLDVTVEGDRFYGTLSGIKVGGAFEVDRAKNGFLKKNDPDLLPLMGLYNIALLGRPVVEPSGYLSLSVGNAGAVKYAGQLADGTKVSGSAKLLAGLNGDGWYAVALYKQLYSKKGFIGGLLWLDKDEKTIRVDSDYDWFVDWVRDVDPKKPGLDFTRELDVLGGYFGTGKDTPKPPDGLTFSAAVPAGLPPPVLLTGGAWVTDAFPLGLEVIYGNAGKLSLAKGFAPKIPKGETEYDYNVFNPSLATLSYTPKTGIFKGSFKLYYDGIDPKNNKLQHKTIGASYTGVMVPDNGELRGLGTGTATINKVKHGVPVRLE